LQQQQPFEPSQYERHRHLVIITVKHVLPRRLDITTAQDPKTTHTTIPSDAVRTASYPGSDDPATSAVTTAAPTGAERLPRSVARVDIKSTSVVEVCLQKDGGLTTDCVSFGVHPVKPRNPR